MMPQTYNNLRLQHTTQRQTHTNTIIIIKAKWAKQLGCYSTDAVPFSDPIYASLYSIYLTLYYT